MQSFDLAAVPGVAECALDDATLAALPADAPPAPWDCELSAVIWWARGGKAATRTAAPAAPVARRALAVVGGMVSYRSTPVGGYHEVYGAIGIRHGRGVRGTIPFMSVDSLTSLVGGRANWSLPKCPAEFTGEPGEGTMTARGRGWQVRATARPFGPRVSMPMAGRIIQPWPDGERRESVLTGKGRGQPAIVTVEVESDGQLATWLRPGKHVGMLLTDTAFSFSEAR
jgi:hypothetical protein